MNRQSRFNAGYRLYIHFLQFCFFVFFFTLFYFTILYWFCHTSTWIHHGCTHVPNPEPPSHLPPHTISLGHPSAPAPSILYPALRNVILTIVILMEIDHGSVPSSPRHDYYWSRRLDFWIVKLGNEILDHQDLTGGPWSKLNLLPVWRLLIFIIGVEYTC